MYFIHISNGKFVTEVYDERIAPIQVTTVNNTVFILITYPMGELYTLYSKSGRKFFTKERFRVGVLM